MSFWRWSRLFSFIVTHSLLMDSYAEIAYSRSPFDSSPDLSRLQTRATAFPARRVRSSFALRAGRGESHLSETSDVELRDLAYLNLDLASHQVDGKTSPPAAGTVVAEKHDSDNTPGQDVVGHTVECNEPELRHASDGLEEPLEPPNIEPDPTDEHFDVVDAHGRSDSHASFHLSKKHISQQLRSMSQLSGPSDESDRLTPEAWTFHRRERSGCYGPTCNVNSSRSRHMHNTSDTGFHSSNVPANLGQVIKEPDTSSSIYSRPTSPELPEPCGIPADLAAVADWPLKTEKDPGALTNTYAEAGTPSCHSSSGDDVHITIVEPELRLAAAEETTLGESCPTEGSQPALLNRTPSYRSGSSSTTKRSRFLERFTPPKKLVRKRRSFFKFLRAGSRHLQPRSISTPVLFSPHLRPLVDGPSDENELLTVQYELTNQDSQPARSVSLGNLPTTGTNESQGVASSPDLRRKPSLADYERHLSVAGDNRRRPSTMELNRLSQIEEDDRHENVASKKFSLYGRTRDTDPLMEAALERQLREKAMFRSPSKRSAPFSETSSMSFIATSWQEPSTTEPQSPERDPLDTAGKKNGDVHLSPPRTPVDGRSRTSSFSIQRRTGSKKPILLHTPSSVSKDSTRSKIASSLDSWSRYPSHTRIERCASAGTADKVHALDFALDIKHERIRGTDESDPFTPGRRMMTERSIRSSKKSLPKSRSATFGSFIRYYSSLFSSPDFHGKNRRTSVAAGGRLDHPELEMLPSVLPSPAKSQPVMHVHEMDLLRPGHLAHIREQTEDVGDKPTGVQMHTHTPGKDLATASIAFRGDSVFTPYDLEQGTSADGSLQPNEPTDYFSANASSDSPQPTNKAAHASNLDGTAETTDPIKRATPSKAQTWSEAYQDCLVIPPSPAVNPPASSDADQDAKTMPPPTLKPTKRRSPSQPAPQPALDPGAAIRRFPSVTVVDDRKGHWRSVSFISVKSSKSGASATSFVRESSNDLLKLMETREREEREKLLAVVV